MSLNDVGFIALIAVALLVLIFCGRRIRFAISERSWRPAELRDAKLVCSEQIFRAEGTVPLVAKIDRGYRDAKGAIILVELKTRKVNRPYPSDIIELSAQRLAVQMQTGERVASYGYVLIQQIGRKSKVPHRVKLLSNEEVIAIARRREGLLSGIVEAGYACSQGLCKRCAFKKECKQTENLIK
jgi:hypothetical protein